LWLKKWGESQEEDLGVRINNKLKVKIQKSKIITTRLLGDKKFGENFNDREKNSLFLVSSIRLLSLSTIFVF
jgi:hypothetical protein